MQCCELMSGSNQDCVAETVPPGVQKRVGATHSPSALNVVSASCEPEDGVLQAQVEVALVDLD